MKFRLISAYFVEIYPVKLSIHTQIDEICVTAEYCVRHSSGTGGVLRLEGFDKKEARVSPGGDVKIKDIGW